MAGVRADIIQLHPFRLRNAVVEHLLLRRSDADDLCPGVWQVITGGVVDDETVADAARRELAEETGLIASRWFVTGHVTTFYFAAFDSVVMSPVIACEVSGDDPTLSAEHAEFAWRAADVAVSTLEFASHREGVAIVESLVKASL